MPPEPRPPMSTSTTSSFAVPNHAPVPPNQPKSNKTAPSSSHSGGGTDYALQDLDSLEERKVQEEQQAGGSSSKFGFFGGGHSNKYDKDDLDTDTAATKKKETVFSRVSTRLFSDKNKKMMNQPEFKKKHAEDKIAVMIVGISMLWLTSLALCQAVVNAFILGPTPDLVNSQAMSSMAWTQDQSVNYHACALRLLTEWNITMQTTLEEEIQTTTIAELYNANLIQEYYLYRNECAADVTYGSTAINYLQTTNNVTDLLATYTTSYSYTDPRCQLVTQMAAGATGGMEALGTSNAYTDSASSTASTLGTQIDNRAVYDATYSQTKTLELATMANTTLVALLNGTEQYFIQANNSYNMYMACQSPSLEYGGQVCPGASTLASVQGVLNQAQVEYQNVLQQVTTWKTQAESVINQVTTFYGNLVDNNDIVQEIDILFGLDQLPSLEQMGFNPNLLSFSLPTMQYPNLQLPDLDGIFNQYVSQSEAYVQSIQQQQEAVATQRAQALQASVTVQARAELAPFDAVVPDVTYYQQKIDNSSGPFLQSMSNALLQAGQQGTAATAQFQANALEASQSEQNASDSYLADVQRRTYSFFVYPGFNFLEYVDAWNTLVNTALGFDYAYRVLQTFMLIRKYWRASAIVLPPADVRKEAGTAAQVDQRDTLQKVAAIITHPYFIAAVILCMAAVCASLFIQLYFPIYQEYVENCVYGDPFTSNGTMITRNAYEISYNYAAADGDATTTNGINQLNSQRTLDCQTQLVASQQNQRAAESNASFIQQKYSNVQYQSFSLYLCLDGSLIQSQHQDTMWKANGLPPTTTWEDIVPGQACNMTMPPLLDATFNCTDVYATNTLCTGPDQPSMLLSTWNAGCIVEWYIHAMILSSIMVFIMYVSINVSRMYILRGIARINWRRLTDGRFSYLGSCNKQGEFLYPKAVVDGDATMKSEIKDAVAKRLTSWQRRGWLLFFWGVALNALWFGPLIAINQTLAMTNVPVLATENPT